MMVDGVRFRESVAPLVEGDYLRYVKPPTSSWDWQGRDWTSNGALTFQAQTAVAERAGLDVTVQYPSEFDQDAALAFLMMHDGVRAFAEYLTRADKVVDRQGRVRLRLDNGKMRLVAKVWPVIEGVTVRAKDTTA